MNDTRFWLVGGAVRDAYLGIRSKDLDFTVEAPSFDAMRDAVLRLGGEIFLESPEYLTIRARVKTAADFVLARRDGAYGDGRRPDSVEPGTIDDDLARRDFTCNAIAVLVDPARLRTTGDPALLMRGAVEHDPHGGRGDIARGTLRAVGRASDRIAEDPLRALRALRFVLTKGMAADPELTRALIATGPAQLATVSLDRIREEVDRCCRAPGGFAAMARLLRDLPSMEAAVYRSVGFRPTLEQAYAPVGSRP